MHRQSHLEWPWINNACNVQSWETTNTFEEGQKMVALRKAYQEVVGQAVDGIEQFWKEYDSYENSLNKITAKKFLNDRTGAYQGARGALRERKVRMEVWCGSQGSLGYVWHISDCHVGHHAACSGNAFPRNAKRAPSNELVASIYWCVFVRVSVYGHKITLSLCVQNGNRQIHFAWNGEM